VALALCLYNNNKILLQPARFLRKRRAVSTMYRKIPTLFCHL